MLVLAMHPRTARTLELAVVAALCLVFVGIAGRVAATRHIEHGEMAHLASGVAILQSGRFDAYPVNPPLARCAAALPVALHGPRTDWQSWQHIPMRRLETLIGRDFERLNAEVMPAYRSWARWCCLSMSLTCGLVGWQWARRVHGSRAAGIVALLLWFLSPTVLANSVIIGPDACAAACGVLAGYCFWRWLQEGTWLHAAWAMVAMGLAELSKFTWLLLFVLWPAIWAAWRCADRWRRQPAAGGAAIGGPNVQSAGAGRPLARQLLAILLGAIWLVNVGYGFQGTMTRLGEYAFFSRTLSGQESIPEGAPGANRFRGTWLAALPVPLPQDYVLGIDLQKVDFEKNWLSYLNGEWIAGGRWYFYLEALLLREPLATWALAALALAICTTAWWRGGRGAGGDCSALRDHLVVIAPALAVLVFISANPEVAFLRYALPAYPFAFVAISRVGAGLRRPLGLRAAAVAASLAWMVTSTASNYPNWVAYFNELAGGPAGGHRYIQSIDIESPDDLALLEKWYLAQPVKRPIRLDVGSSGLGHSLRGAVVQKAPLVPAETIEHLRRNGMQIANADGAPRGPVAGWYAVAACQLSHPKSGYGQALSHLEPIRQIGNSILVYWLTVEDANRLRRQFGLPTLE